jgi:hypothetical protein
MKVKDTFYISWLTEVGEENGRQKEQITPPKMTQVLPKEMYIYIYVYEYMYLSCQEYLLLEK